MHNGFFSKLKEFMLSYELLPLMYCNYPRLVQGNKPKDSFINHPQTIYRAEEDPVSHEIAPCEATPKDERGMMQSKGIFDD
jgi:hypothetical protein